MAKPVRKPPSPSDYKDFRAFESFFNDLFEQHRRVGTVTVDPPSIAAGATTTIDIPVAAALADIGQTVAYGAPSAITSTRIMITPVISADGVVTLTLYNPTGAPVDLGSGVYSAKVGP